MTNSNYYRRIADGRYYEGSPHGKLHLKLHAVGGGFEFVASADEFKLGNPSDLSERHKSLVEMEEWPSSSCTWRSDAPPCSRCVAKLWRSV